MEQNVNLIGATVFWLYILAALTFTALVLQTISHLPTPKPDRRNSLRVFSGLALVSFATLSYSMLHVLILSYNEWTTRQTLDPFAKTLSLGKIWKWSITSTLFQDFGDAIVENDVRFFWVQSALLATFSVCIHMAMEGKSDCMANIRDCTLTVSSQGVDFTCLDYGYSSLCHKSCQSRSSRTCSTLPSCALHHKRRLPRCRHAT